MVYNIHRKTKINNTWAQFSNIRPIKKYKVDKFYLLDDKTESVIKYYKKNRQLYRGDA